MQYESCKASSIAVISVQLLLYSQHEKLTDAVFKRLFIKNIIAPLPSFSPENG